MELSAFIESLRRLEPPAGLPPLLLALWKDARGDWDGAHDILQDLSGPTAARVHAYLHRKEGDFDNALYWYRIARRRPRQISLDDEWRSLSADFLAAVPPAS